MVEVILKSTNHKKENYFMAVLPSFVDIETYNHLVIIAISVN